MIQLSLFDEYLVSEVRREVISQFPRMEQESYDEWLEVIRVEVDYRLKELRRDKPKPDYFHGLK